MKSLHILLLTLSNVPPVQEVPALLDREAVPFEVINTVNWAEYPYTPEVHFRMAATKTALLLNYRVKEATVRAVAEADNGPVWQDSCVEFFCSPDSDGIYYNFECNCVGRLLIGSGSERNKRDHAPREVLESVLRYASLGTKSFEERPADGEWEVALVIPFTAFYRHHISSFAGKTFRANFYKCGDKLTTPHFLSWNPIEISKPDFHRPDYFGTVIVE
jgi:hypothetical protein